MNNVLSPKITMLTTDSCNSIAGRVCLNGHEWVIQPFEVAKGASATEKENKLIERAIKEHGE
tara:strand:- start:715 stop:900 length:186 start_codon:yes stop_codon:yes gene_type:complete